MNDEPDEPASYHERRNRNWEMWYLKLLGCRQPDGTLRVDTSGPNSVYGLAQWCNEQRLAYRRGKMSPERVARMEEAGFLWEYDRQEEAWREKYRELEQYRQQHGHARVLSTAPGCSRLFVWLERQRYLQRHGQLPEERVRLLDALGVQWGAEGSGRAIRAEAKEAVWRGHLAKLVAFKEQHGHCLVPDRVPEVAALRRWVVTQRSEHKKGRLAPQRVAALRELGFAWDATLELKRLALEDPALMAQVSAMTPARRRDWRGRLLLRRD